MNELSRVSKEKKNFDLINKKENIICSLKEVESFLNDLSLLSRYIKLYHILK